MLQLDSDDLVMSMGSCRKELQRESQRSECFGVFVRRSLE